MEPTRGVSFADGPPSAGATGLPPGPVGGGGGGGGGGGPAGRRRGTPVPLHVGAAAQRAHAPPAEAAPLPPQSPPFSPRGDGLPPSPPAAVPPPPSRLRVRFAEDAGVASPPSPPSPRSGHSGASGGSGGSGDSGADVPVFFHTEIHTRLCRLAARVTARDVELAGLDAGMTRLRLDAIRGEEERSRLALNVTHLRAVIDIQMGAITRLRRELADSSRQVAAARAERDRYAWLAVHVHDGAVPGPDGRSLGGHTHGDVYNDGGDGYDQRGDPRDAADAGDYSGDTGVASVGGDTGIAGVGGEGHATNVHVGDAWGGGDGSGGNVDSFDHLPPPAPVMPPNYLVEVATASAARAVATATASTARLCFRPTVPAGPRAAGAATWANPASGMAAAGGTVVPLPPGLVVPGRTTPAAHNYSPLRPPPPSSPSREALSPRALVELAASAAARAVAAAAAANAHGRFRSPHTNATAAAATAAAAGAAAAVVVPGVAVPLAADVDAADGIDDGNDDAAVGVADRGQAAAVETAMDVPGEAA